MTDKNIGEQVIKNAVASKRAAERITAPVFTLEQLMQSAQFSKIEKDFMTAYINEPMTVVEARKLLDKKMKEAVK